MPAFVMVLLFVFLLSVLLFGLWAGSNQADRRLLLWIMLFSVVVSLALVTWLFSQPQEDITNSPITSER